MISHVRGRIVERRPGQVVVDVGGVGFGVSVSDATLSLLPPPGHDARLLTVLHVREDALQLFGFATADERLLFERLLTVSGVGPKVALAILSTMPVAAFLCAVAEGTPRPITAVPGVGKRLAERLVVELRDRLEALEPVRSRAAGATGTPGGAGAPASAGGRGAMAPREEAVTALMALGLPKAAAADLVTTAAGDAPKDVSVEDLIRRSLSVLAGHA